MALASCTSTEYMSPTASPMLSTSEATASDDTGIQTVTGGDHTTATSGGTQSTSGTGNTSDDSTSDPGTDSDSSSSSTSSGPGGECGNGILEGNEFCDDGNADDFDDCTHLCRPPTCGDGIVHAGEDCDDGNDDNTDSCTDSCKYAACGDGFVQDGEECDDGNTDETDACLNSCAAAKCGDGKLHKGVEVCDDFFNDGSYGGCMPGCGALGPFCGNGVHEPIDELNNPLGFEYCDGSPPFTGVGCTDGCLYDFSQVTQMYCAGSCSWAGPQGCDQQDADAFCRLRTGKLGAKAKSFQLGPPTDLGGFPCIDKNQPIELDGKDPRLPLGNLPEYGIGKPAYYMPTKLKTAHYGGTNTSTILGASLVCD